MTTTVVEISVASGGKGAAATAREGGGGEEMELRDDEWEWVPYPLGHRKRESFIRNYKSMLEAREASKLHRYVPSVQATLEGEHFQALRRRKRVLTFDTSAHPILETFVDLIDTDSLSLVDDRRRSTHLVDLSRLHDHWTSFDRGSSHLVDKAKLLAPMAMSSDARTAFAAVYDRLFLDVIAPAVASAMPGETRLLYASFPCVRIQQPCDFHTIRCHVDSMYCHPAGSLNCWLPLTTTYGANTLHLESSPGAEDFSPLELRYGQVAVFDGTTCAHYTLANTTDHTRVSLDFRVVPGSAFDPDAECSRVKGGGQCYNIGGYYSEARLMPRRRGSSETEETTEAAGAAAAGDTCTAGDEEEERVWSAGHDLGVPRRWVRTVAGRPNIRHGFPHKNAESEVLMLSDKSKVAM